jgi:hypothetical protein
MQKEDILKYLNILNKKLKKKGIKGQIGLFGGTVMCLAFNARKSTKDIDAIFEPKETIYTFAKQIADENNLSENWLNDSVKGFLSKNIQMKVFKNMSHLTIYIPSAEYMLAMKCVSARLTGSKDVDDVIFLLNYLNIKTTEEALEIIKKYFPPDRIPLKTEYFLIELFQNTKVDDKNEN